MGIGAEVEVATAEEEVAPLKMLEIADLRMPATEVAVAAVVGAETEQVRELALPRSFLE